MMYHIPGVLSAQDVAWFREQLDAADWVDTTPCTLIAHDCRFFVH